MGLKAVRFAGAFLALSSLAMAESGYDGWLRYAPLGPTAAQFGAHMPSAIYAVDSSPIVASAQSEMIAGFRSLLGGKLTAAADMPESGAIVLCPFDALTKVAPDVRTPAGAPEGAYLLKTITLRGHRVLLVAGAGPRGVLYGAFALLRRIAQRREIAEFEEYSAPSAPIRWTNEWENLDGTIERGYAGRAIFFDQDHVATDLTRAGDYARLLASVGINGCAANNVNANPRILSPEFLPELARLAAALRPWGVRMALSVPFGSPKIVGGLDTFDPLDKRVQTWWKQKVDEVYRAVPDLAGFVVKADSEGQAGPSAYGRTHADAANLIARALAPHGGVLLYRGFVYDHHMDWRNPKNDRARAAWDNFHTLDGRFDSNVILQIKHGPIDFQVREPVSPVFGALPHTNTAIELQITQEYTGQQRHLCFLVPMWKQALDFDLRSGDGATRVEDIVSSRAAGRAYGGYVGVSNVGLDRNWLGHDLAMANLYGFARLAWNPELSSDEIADEWTRLTFGHDPLVVSTINALLLDSWPAYERYTGPLGAGTLTDIIQVHFGPGIESSERNGWGQWHRADEHGIGMDRTVATGTGYIGQYAPPVAAQYESLDKCPDELLLFMHHVPYTHLLHSGKTVIQHIYDSHYDGASEAQTFPQRWERLHGSIDEQRYRAVLARLDFQAAHAIVWRDAVCDWFRKMSGIPDAQGRVGHHPGRVEAEAMKLDGYEGVAVTPWETASGGNAIACPGAACSASMRFDGSAGPHNIVVRYFDTNNGAASFRLLVAGKAMGEWRAEDTLPSDKPNGHTSTRWLRTGVELHRGDEIRIEARPDGGDRAALDYVEIEPSANGTPRR